MKKKAAGSGGLRVKLTDKQMREQMLHPELPLYPDTDNTQESSTATTQIQISLGDVFSILAIIISVIVIVVNLTLYW